MNRKGKKAQQEMVGFVLIVVLVVVVMMVFLVLSIREPGYEESESLAVSNMLNSIMGYTTSCAISFEPQYDTVEDLIKSAYLGDYCSNIERPAKDYLNESLKEILEALVESEALIEAYEFSVSIKDEGGEEGFLKVSGGNSSKSTNSLSSQRLISYRSSKLLIRLKISEEKV